MTWCVAFGLQGMADCTTTPTMLMMIAASVPSHITVASTTDVSNESVDPPINRTFALAVTTARLSIRKNAPASSEDARVRATSSAAAPTTPNPHTPARAEIGKSLKVLAGALNDSAPSLLIDLRRGFFSQNVENSGDKAY